MSTAARLQCRRHGTDRNFEACFGNCTYGMGIGLADHIKCLAGPQAKGCGNLT